MERCSWQLLYIFFIILCHNVRERVTRSRMNRRTDINQKYFQKTGVSSAIAKTERNRAIEPIVAVSAVARNRVSHHPQPPNAVFY
jgi:hypothetical protein